MDTSDSILSLEQLQETEWDLQSQIHQVRQLELQLEELQRAHSTVESIRQRLSQQSTTDTASLEAYRLTLEHLFEGHRFAHSDLTQEGIMQVSARIGEAIGKTIRKIGKKTKEILDSTFKTVDNLEKRHQVALSALEEIQGAEPNNATVKVSGPQRLYYQGSIEGRDVAEGIKNAGDMLREFQTSMIGFAQTYFQQFSEHQEQAADVDEESETEIAEVAEEVESEQQSLLAKLTQATEDMGENPLPGGKAIIPHTSKRMTIKTDSGESKFLAPKIGDDPNAEKFDGEKKIETPSTDDLETILEGVGQMIQNLSGHMDDIRGTFQSAAAVKSRAEEMQKTRREHTTTNMAELGLLGPLVDNLFGNNAIRLADAVSMSILDLLPYQYQTSRSALVYVERAIKAYT